MTADALTKRFGKLFSWSFLALGLAGLAHPASAHPTPKVYKMLGTEPFWSLGISARTMTFDGMDTPKVVQKTPKFRKTKYGRIYWTRRIQVAIIENQPCSDGMSDYIYRDDVKVTVDGTQFNGCGGSRRLRKDGVRP